MTTYRIEGEDLTRGQIVARLPHINQRTIGARLLRGYRTWADIGADKATTLRRSKARFAGWQIQPKKNTAAARIEIEHLRARVASLEESLHYANGVADLAMKHRDDAENRVAELEQDAEIGRKWRADSSLATWFPFTAEEIERLRGLIAAHVNASNNDDSAGDTFGALAEAVQDAP